MKTRLKITSAKAASISKSRVNFVMVLAGVIIAVVCSLVLFQHITVQTASGDAGISALSNQLFTNTIAGVRSLVSIQ